MIITSARDRGGMTRLLLIACVVVTCASVACDKPPPTGCAPTGITTHRDVRYRTTAGVPANKQSLDLYLPKLPAGCPATPLVAYVHGGGFTGGDKGNQIADKRDLFTGEGWAFASINYRLGDAGHYPKAEEDVAGALAYLRSHAAVNRTDPNRTLLLGHSAGAFLVSLVSTNAKYLGRFGLDLHAIACTASNDTSYDIPHEIAQGGRQATMFRNAFGDDPKVWVEASPARNVAPNKGIPDFHIITRGTAHRVGEAQAFGDALVRAGVPARVVVARGMSHDEVNAAVGAPGDTRITPALMAFYRSCGRLSA
jgi:acetyl esterase/lipase